MAKYGECNFDGLKDLQKKLERLQEREREQFTQACAKELAARLLAKVIKRTPVGEYSGGEYQCKAKVGGGAKHISAKVPGKQGGTLRRGWTAQASGNGSEGLKTRSAEQYVDTLKVHHFKDTYVIEITNPVEYASYVEYGHRTVNHKSWVPGHFMLTISEKEIRDAAPGIIEKKLQKQLEEIFK